MKRWVGCSFAKGHADYSPIVVLKLIFDTVIRAAYFLIFFFLKIFWKILVSEKEPSPKGQKLRVYRLVLAL